MANLTIDFGGDNEYIGMAEAARKKAGGGGLGSLLQGIGEALGISKPVAKAPEGESSETGDLASTAPTKDVTVTDSKGDVLGAVKAATDPGPKVERLPMASQAVSGPLIEVDPDTGIPLIKIPGLKANNNFGPVRQR